MNKICDNTIIQPNDFTSGEHPNFFAIKKYIHFTASIV